MGTLNPTNSPNSLTATTTTTTRDDRVASELLLMVGHMRSIECPSSYNRFYPRDVVSAVFATAMWLAGWVSVRHTPVL